MCGINGVYYHQSIEDVENKVKQMNSLTAEGQLYRRLFRFNSMFRPQ